MQLAAWKATPAEYHPIRDLTASELALHKQLIAPFLEAENRLLLFRVLELNYQEWISFINSLLSKENHNSKLKLNQLLFNYLTVSYSITEHFKRSYSQKFRRNKGALEKYTKFIAQLQKASWAFCFFQDFRNYVQHCELPIGGFRRAQSLHRVEISITHEASFLLKDYKSWQKSNLNESHGTIDLITLLQDYHVQLIQNYAAFVARSFYPLLEKAEEFYSKLRNEALQGRQGYRMIFGEHTSKPNANGGSNIDIQFEDIPNDVYAELGIKIK